MISTNPSRSAPSVAALDLTVRRVRHPLEMRRVRVVRTAEVTPGVANGSRCVTFAGERLHHFVSASFDDHVKLVLPAVPGTELVLPVLGPNGPTRPEGAPPVVLRDYTPRRFDVHTGELDIELDLHGDGPAATWARHAVAGQEAGIGGPRGSFLVPTAFPWHLLIGDESALPAICRRLEELPAGVRAFVVASTATPASRRQLTSRATLDVTWCNSDDELLAKVHAFPLPAKPGYTWAAGESQVMRTLRGILRDEHQLEGEHTRVTAYWKRGVADHHEAVV